MNKGFCLTGKNTYTAAAWTGGGRGVCGATWRPQLRPCDVTGIGALADKLGDIDTLVNNEPVLKFMGQPGMLAP